MIVCETPRLRIRHFTLDDASFILRLLNEPSFIENITDKGVRTLDGARGYLRDGPLASYAKFGLGLNQVESKDGATPIGMCGMLKRDNLEHPDIGYALLPEFHGQGYALEAAQGVMTAYRRDHARGRILAIVKPENSRSIHLLEKLGMRAEGMYRLNEHEPELRLYGRDV